MRQALRAARANRSASRPSGDPYPPAQQAILATGLASPAAGLLDCSPLAMLWAGFIHGDLDQ